MNGEISGSFAPEDTSRTVRGSWTGTYSPPKVEGIKNFNQGPWNSLFLGENTVWWWMMGAPGPISGYAPDLTSLPYFEVWARAVGEIKSGIGKLILSGTKVNDGIAIHFSESSRIVDSLLSPASNDWKSEYEDGVGNVANSLANAGFGYRFVAYKEVEKGVLRDRDYKVLFLPHSRAVSDEEVDKILEFARAGGVVIADIVPATLRETGGKRSVPALRELFPSNTAGTVARFGGGLGVLMGTDMLKGYYRPGKDRDRWRAVAALLKTHAGIDPAVTMVSPGGDVTPTNKRFLAGGIELVGTTFEGPARINISRKAHLYAVRKGAYLGYSDEFDRPADHRNEVFRDLSVQGLMR